MEAAAHPCPAGNVPTGSINCVAGEDTGVSINGGAAYTNDPDVTLDVTAPACATGIRLSNDGGFSNVTSRAAEPQVAWRLDDSVEGQFTKVVYLRLAGPGLDAALMYSDDIILDTVRPVVTSTTAEQATAAGAGLRATAAPGRRAAYRVVVAAKDDRSGVATIQVNTKKTAKKAASTKYRKTTTVRLAGSAPRSLFVRVSDGAGNWSA